MNVQVLEAPAAPRPSQARPTQPGPRATPRPLRRLGPGTGPQARPARRFADPVVTCGAAAPRACRVPAAAPAASPRVRVSSWRLTDRAIALVLVTGLVVVVAALAVVGLTAVRVTGDRYQGQGLSGVVASAPSLP